MVGGFNGTITQTQKIVHVRSKASRVDIRKSARIVQPHSRTAFRHIVGGIHQAITRGASTGHGEIGQVSASALACCQTEGGVGTNAGLEGASTALRPGLEGASVTQIKSRLTCIVFPYPQFPILCQAGIEGGGGWRVWSRNVSKQATWQYTKEMSLKLFIGEPRIFANGAVLVALQPKVKVVLNEPRAQAGLYLPRMAG